MCIQYHIAGGTLDRRFRFFFFVKNDFFLKFVDEHERQNANFPRILFWEEWGVDNTRFMAYGMQPRWLRLVPRFMSSRAFFCFVFSPSVSLVSMPLARARTPPNTVPFPCGRYVHGLKVVCPPYPSDRNKWACVLEVFDFNVHPKKLPEVDNTIWSADLARASGGGVSVDAEVDTSHGRTDLNSERSISSSPLSSSSSPPPTRPSTPSSMSTIAHEVSFTVHSEPSIIPASSIFVNDVFSKLPYTHTVRKDLCAAYSGFMIDDERIVGLKVSIVSIFCSWRALRRVNVRYIYRLRRMERWGI